MRWRVNFCFHEGLGWNCLPHNRHLRSVSRQASSRSTSRVHLVSCNTNHRSVLHPLPGLQSDLFFQPVLIQNFHEIKYAKDKNEKKKYICLKCTAIPLQMFSFSLHTGQITSQDNIRGWEGWQIRMHNPTMSLDWVLPATTVWTIWATVRFFSSVS